MKIRSLHLKNIRGYIDSNEILLSQGVNLFIGANNSGKSTIIRSTYFLQGQPFDSSVIRKGENSGKIDIGIMDIQSDERKVLDKNRTYPMPQTDYTSVSVGFNNTTTPNFFDRSLQTTDGLDFGFNNFMAVEPYNIIYPYLSKRNLHDLSEEVGLNSHEVTGNFSNLNSKIDRICNPQYPSYEDYKKACLETLGFIVSTSPTAKGKSASIVISEFDHIPIKDMGEGVVNILGLIVNLCVAKHKIFIIEEMENDIHPKALKGVLSLIEKKSDTNQFLISTHSNIVTKYLGSLPGAKMFNVSSTFSHESRIPISKVEEIGESVLDRRKILEELGYELYDNDLWKAWLFLEESSAETVIKDFLMPVFVPQLFGKMKTFSANGVDSIEPKFTDFNKLFVFLHLEPQYKNRVWVLIDGGVREKGIIDDFKKKYVEGNNWNEKNFSQFSQHCFEKYYPDIFTKDVAAIDLLKDKKARKKAKEELLLKVKQWWEENPDLAKTEFQKSAAEVIDILKEIANYI